MYKNQLQELAQRSCFNLPSYSSVREGPHHALQFKATVSFNGETFESPAFFSTLRQAENAAAEVALKAVSSKGPSKSLAVKVLDETGIYKNLLQEIAQRAGIKLPVYTTTRSGTGHTPSFTCTVEIAGMSFTGDSAKTKKQAQKNAAIVAWDALNKKPNFGCSSSSSLVEHQSNDDQEVVDISNMHEKDKRVQSSRTVQHKSRRGPDFVRHGIRPKSNMGFRAMPFRSWMYTPEVPVYPTWLHAQSSQEQAQLMRLPAPSNGLDARFIPFLHSGYQPSQAQVYPPVDIEPVIESSLPCFTQSTSGQTDYFLNTSRFVSSRTRSQVTTQEILDDQHSDNTEQVSLPPEATDKPPADGRSSHQESPEDGQPNCREGHMKLSVGEETNDAHHVSKSAASSLSVEYSSSATMKVQENQHLRRSPKSVSRTLIQHVVSSSESPHFSKQNRGSMDATQSGNRIHQLSSSSTLCRSPGPPIIQDPGMPTSAVLQKSGSGGGLGGSIRLNSQNSNSVLCSPCFRAPPVHVRPLVPVCSAPPPRKPAVNQMTRSEKSAVKETEKAAITELTSEFDEFRM